MYKIYLLENLKKRDHLGYLGVDGRIILKRMLKKCGVTVWSGFAFLMRQQDKV
jgi:hypothetical protein